MQVEFACNDERGLFTGKAERVQVGELDLECTLIGGGVQMKHYAEEKSLLKVGRVVVKFTSYRYGVGNWCWDGYAIPDEDVVRIINYLERQKYWTTCTCVEWIQNQPIPGKLIGFKCSACGTQYFLYPNGEITFEQHEEFFASQQRRDDCAKTEVKA